MTPEAGVPEVSAHEVSVIIPVRNGAATIVEQLTALASQETGRSWELVVVDNGSTDATMSLVANLSREHADLDLRVVTADEATGASHARNVGVAAAAGTILLFCDADDRVAPGWLGALAGCVESAGIAGGALDRRSINDPARLPSGTELRGELHRSTLGTPFAVSANVGVMRWLFDSLSGFDERLVAGCEDVDLSLRATLAGHEPVFCDGATVHYRDRTSYLDNARQTFAYAKAEPLLYRLHGESWGPRRSMSEGLRFWLSLLAFAPNVVRGPAHRVRFVRRLGRGAGRIVGSITHRSLFL